MTFSMVPSGFVPRSFCIGYGSTFGNENVLHAHSYASPSFGQSSVMMRSRNTKANPCRPLKSLKLVLDTRHPTYNPLTTRLQPTTSPSLVIVVITTRSTRHCRQLTESTHSCCTHVSAFIFFFWKQTVHNFNPNPTSEYSLLPD
jgi:hypothetical protein